MVVSGTVSNLIGYEIGNLIIFPLLSMLFMKLLLKIRFKEYEIGWKDAFRLSFYTFGIVIAISLVANFIIGALFGFLQPVFVIIDLILIVAAIHIARKFLTKIGMKNKLLLFSIVWIIGTYVLMGILFVIGSA